MQSDLMQHDVLAAACGQKMNRYGIITLVSRFDAPFTRENSDQLVIQSIQSIHADIAFTLCEYLYKKIHPRPSRLT